MSETKTPSFKILVDDNQPPVQHSLGVVKVHNQHYGVAFIRLTPCVVCEKFMVDALNEGETNSLFPFLQGYQLRDQMKRHKWRFRSNQRVNGHYVCEDCTDVCPHCKRSPTA